jgi:mRNA-degrading endonuclease RelE of RelBE toxin-antitoxin system
VSLFEIQYAESVAEDLRKLRAYDRKIELDRIDQQLTHEPTMPTRARKIVVELKPPWQHKEPIWELRVGGFRVFYDVDEQDRQVTVRAVRRKPPHTTTEEVL